jgi:sugar/nucleoside kinase (ribokinase family)
VLLDAAGEPAYLGHGGDLAMSSMPDRWKAVIQEADALFADGWAEHAGVPPILLEGFRLAKAASVPIFFDPGPGNPAVDGAWVRQAIRLSTVLLANEDELKRISGKANVADGIQIFLEDGVGWVVAKRGVHGCLLATKGQVYEGAQFKAALHDTTGAGDSVAGAVIFAYINKLPKPEIVTLANATGAAKAQKFGTGLNMPTMAEVRAMLGGTGESAKILKYLERSEL